MTNQQHATEQRREDRITTRPLTDNEARIDLAHLAGMTLEIDRQIATQPRRLAKRWAWSIVGVERFMAAEAARKVRP